jgi:hypothetical protein
VFTFGRTEIDPLKRKKGFKILFFFLQISSKLQILNRKKIKKYPIIIVQTYDTTSFDLFSYLKAISWYMHTYYAEN